MQMFHTIWIQSFFPYEWGKATIIQIPKPQKDHSDPQQL